jgi:hypothetical protein
MFGRLYIWYIKSNYKRKKGKNIILYLKEWWDVLCDMKKSEVLFNNEKSETNFLNLSEEDYIFFDNIMFIIENFNFEEKKENYLILEDILRGYFSEYIQNQINLILTNSGNS